MENSNLQELTERFSEVIDKAVQSLVDKGVPIKDAVLKVAEIITEELNKNVEDGYKWSVICTKDASIKELQYWNTRAIEHINDVIRNR